MHLRRRRSYLTQFERCCVIGLREGGFFFYIIAKRRDRNGLSIVPEDRVKGGHVALLRGKTTVFVVRLWRIVMRLRQKFEVQVEGNVILQNTKFGYLVTGTLPQSQQQANCCLISEPSLDITEKKFFELESLPDDSKEITKSEEEIYCEEHFVSTYKSDKTGRFIVRLPIKENAETLLGYSKENAIKRLNGIWEKLNKNNTMGTLYKEFMNEYELLGHMEEIKNETLDKINYYIPHHSVYKPEKTSTPLRVVFDASAKTTSGFSLNSIFLLNGGIILQDFFSIVSRFRKHEYAFSADIKKMYRQILVDPNQRDLQRIMWKTSADAPVKTYKLATVTYGTVSAPFLATRTLKALADEEKAEFPDAADVICNDSYMDNILSGESTLEGAKKLQTRLSQLLQRGGFELHKWVSNSPELLKDLSASSPMCLIRNFRMLQ
ncbi:integrase catalytic domain-containing protein [Trichonephila clavipes]|nr:integrase catalytic domain-containing protein [Trichonephila clavipes]